MTDGELALRECKALKREGCSLADLEALLPFFHVGSCDLIQAIIGIDQLLLLAAGASTVPYISCGSICDEQSRFQTGPHQQQEPKNIGMPTWANPASPEHCLVTGRCGHAYVKESRNK